MNDLRLAFRLFRRHPVLWAAAVLSLALGIVANTAAPLTGHGEAQRVRAVSASANR